MSFEREISILSHISKKLQARQKNVAKIDGPVKFLLYDLYGRLIAFLNDVDIQLILEVKSSFENTIQSFLKVFFWIPCIS